MIASLIPVVEFRREAMKQFSSSNYASVSWPFAVWLGAGHTLIGDLCKSTSLCGNRSHC